MRVETVDQVLQVYWQRGHRSYGEGVTELAHALQCATLAVRADDHEELVAAALLHDFGHLCHDLGEDVAARGQDAQHEVLGAEALRHLFEAPVVAAIRLHVDAKRYLCGTSAQYAAGLSDASRQSLVLQGGAMTMHECRAFEQQPHAALAVRVRRHDDGGKVLGMATLRLGDFRSVLMRVARAGS